MAKTFWSLLLSIVMLVAGGSDLRGQNAWMDKGVERSDRRGTAAALSNDDGKDPGDDVAAKYALAEVSKFDMLVDTALHLACSAGTKSDLTAALKRSPAFSNSNIRVANIGYAGWRLEVEVPGGQLKVERMGPLGKLRHAAVRYDAMGGKRPILLVVADHQCVIRTAQRLLYDAAGRAEWLEDLNNRLESTGSRLALNPPVPSGVDPLGVPVAMIDTGVNYLLPDIGKRLARDKEGRLLGYDYWDLDQRPFDIRPTNSPFSFAHHGTQTASLLLREAPIAKIVPYRYPGTAMGRMPLLIENAATLGVRLVNISLVSRDREAWLPFLKAARRHSEMLFIVAAGNDGRNVDRQAIYPAGLPLDNLIVVTSAGRDGHLADNANWGPGIVDLMVSAEEVAVLDFDGRQRHVSGSSYAAVRVTALAACLLASQTDLSATALKNAIFAEARQVTGFDRTAQGLIPNSVFSNRGACRQQPLVMMTPNAPSNNDSR